jgi:hypothetical protein
MFLIRQSLIAVAASRKRIVLHGFRAGFARCRIKCGKLKTQYF